MIEQKDGWFVVNVKDARWYGNSSFGKVCSFEQPDARFPETGVHLFVLEPGKPNCRYHRENAQEDFLVLSGQCKLLVNDEERQLGAWDYFHCPPGVNHVFVGAGDGPCAILMIGRRDPDKKIVYPVEPAAAQYGASVDKETASPAESYAAYDPPRPGPASDLFS